MKLQIRILLSILLLSGIASAQITSGKILFERKTNLYKRFKNEDWVTNWVKESDKTKVDEFELFFNDSLASFRAKENDEKENYSWMTSKSSTYQNVPSNTTYAIKDIWGNKVIFSDTLHRRKWKITDSNRTIAGFNCRKAIWMQNDTTRIYAWYCNEISSDFGPESFCGLPGMILGLATEDGGVIYFAKSIEQGKQDLSVLLPPKTKEKIFTAKELKAKFQKEYGKEKWSKDWITNIFDVW
ncbi:MAG: GLPGLI family protein [Bacteroidetes bacterium]|nr:GLPGLI family protein [Bacteroidota bacterium]